MHRNVFNLRKLTALFTLMGGLMAVEPGAQAAAPVNDLCADAMLIPDVGPFPVLTTPVDITDAGTSGDPADTTCSAGNSRSVWYRFRPTQSALYSLTVSMDTATTVRDTVRATPWVLAEGL